MPKHGSIILYVHGRKPEGSLGRTAQDGHLDSHTAPELCFLPHFTAPLNTLLHFNSLREQLDFVAANFDGNGHAHSSNHSYPSSDEYTQAVPNKLIECIVQLLGQCEFSREQNKDTHLRLSKETVIQFQLTAVGSSDLGGKGMGGGGGRRG